MRLAELAAVLLASLLVLTPGFQMALHAEKAVSQALQQGARRMDSELFWREVEESCAQILLPLRYPSEGEEAFGVRVGYWKGEKDAFWDLQKKEGSWLLKTPGREISCPEQGETIAGVYDDSEQLLGIRVERKEGVHVWFWGRLPWSE